MSRERPPAIVVRAVRPSDGGESDLALLGSEERRHAAGMRDRSSRRLFVARRAFLRRELAALSRRPPQDIVLGREPCARCGAPHARPYAMGIDVHFCVSSVRGATPVMGLALADRPVGFDLEQFASFEVVRDVTPSLHPRERAQIAAAFEVSADAGARTFTQLWTRKEALLKATGEGLTAPLDRDDVSAAATPVPGLRIASWNTGRPGLVGAWALRTRRS